MYAVLLNGKNGSSYSIGGNSQKTNLEVVGEICDILENILPRDPQLKSRYHDLITFVKDRPGHDLRYAIDTGKICNNLQWQPKETFQSGLRKTVEWYIDNKAWLKNIKQSSKEL
jgi:dTDP-glucose 4,6-dehydratase